MEDASPEMLSIFASAIERPSLQERAAFLDTVCGADVELRRRMESLLRAHDEAGGFLRDPSAASDSPATIDQTAGGVVGALIGPYKMLEAIGEGGMGTVWMAQQTEPVKRLVALKLIKPGMDSKQVIARFEAERQALALMDHPNIARVLDGGTTKGELGGVSPGRPYFVMDLVKGVPITRYCDEHHLTPRQRLQLFIPVCQAVQHAHQKGIIHRDLKPSNVLVALYDSEPVPKVIDFGVAKAAGQSLTDKTLVTGFGAIVGTLEYMSPEQAEINQLDIDTRSDIYALGVLLYELLAGSPPFSRKELEKAGMLEMLRVIREQEPSKPSTKLSTAEGLPTLAANRGTEPAKLTKLLRGELDWIVMKALEKDRNRRYETANGLALDLERYLGDQPVQACPPSLTYRARKFAGRNRGVLAASGIVAIALIVGTGVSIWEAIRARDAETATKGQLQLTQQAEEKATQRLYRSVVAQARGIRLSRRMGQRFTTLEVLAEATKMARDMKLPGEDFLTLRNETIACLALSDIRVAKEWDGYPAGSWSYDFAGTMEHYVRVDRQGAVSVRRVADDAEICRLPGLGSGESWPIFSPDGNFLVLSRDDQFELWKLDDHTPARLLDGLNTLNTSHSFSPDSRQFAFARSDGSLVIHELPSGQQIKQLGNGPAVIGNLAFHPKERQLAVCHTAGVQVRDLDTGNVVAELAQPMLSVGGHCLAWHPDGKSLAVVSNDRTIVIWDVGARTPIARLQGHTNSGINIAFNHAGNLLASGAWDGTVRLWDPRTGQPLFQTALPTQHLRFSLDDRFLAGAYDGNKLLLLEVGPAIGYRTLVRNSSRQNGTGAIHPEGRLLAVGLRNETGLWDLNTGAHLGVLPSGPGYPQVLFEPSGSLLTNGSAGLYRWPIKQDATSADLLRIGPSQKLPIPASVLPIDCSADGRVLGSAQFDGGLVWHADRPDEPVPLKPHHDVRYIAVSPSGRLVATGSHSGTKVRIWNAVNGNLEKELPVEIGSTVGFSPDGKWLATNRWNDNCLWAVDGWQQGPEIGGVGFAFSPDTKMLAAETGHGVVRLLDPASGREYAQLEDPNQDRSMMIFNPDGTQLITICNDSNMIHVWDLQTIRTELAKLGLDWDMPPYPAPSVDGDRRSLQIEIDVGEKKN